MSGLLTGRCVVITRSRSQSEDLVRRLVQQGAEAIVCPAIAILPAAEATLRLALSRVSDYDCVVFTSANAVAAVFEQLATLPRIGSALATRRIAAVGAATAAALQAQGIRPDVIPADARGEALAVALGDVRGQYLLLPRSDLARESLPAALRAGGATIDDVVAYHTVPAASLRELPAILRARHIDALTFASPSAVRFTVAALGNAAISLAEPTPGRPAIVCIGPVTAAEARQHGIEPDAVAEQPDGASVIATLIELFGVQLPTAKLEHAEGAGR